MEPCRSGSVRVPAFRSSPTGPSAKLCRPGHSGGHSGVPAVVLSRRQGPPVATDQRHCASEDTLNHLISIIEQLKSKDKVISQLERELGHPAVLAAAGPVSMATEVTRHATSSSGQPSSSSSKMETPPVSPHHVLSGLQQVFQRLHGTGMASFPLGGEEKGAVEGFAGLEAEILGLHDRAQALALDRQMLFDKLKEFEVKNKQLVEKNKRFLEKNVQLTAHNRILKDGSHTMLQQNKKLQEESEDCRRKQCELARELQRVKGQNLELEAQAQEVEALRKQIADQTSSITLLRQSCTDKDRRIELIQHRKKRRRLLRSQEKCQGVKETFYGYDDDDNDTSVDSETSQSSVSVSTISEEDACDELSREELERSHRQMLREHLQLERSHALLQAHAGSSQDPYRELQTRSQLQADLFSAQCRIELLEKEIRTLQSKQRRGTGVDGGLPDTLDVMVLLKERDDLLSARHGLQLKLEQVDGECVRLRQELRQAEERAEDLEFRILELEENPSCEGHDPSDPDPYTPPPPDKDLDPHHDNDDPDLLVKEEGHSAEAAGKEEEEEGEGGKEEVTECITRTVAPAAVEGQPGQLSSSPDYLPAPDEVGSMEFERLRGELKKALERQGVRAEVVLKELGGLKDMEQKVTSMERMAMEMQKKVIALQQERDGLEERLMRGAPLSLNAEVERRQNLELKEEISQLSSAKDECCAKNSRLAKQLEESEHLCISLQEQLKEFLEPSGSITIGSQSILGPGQQNRADVRMIGEETGLKRVVPCSNKYIQTDRSSDAKRREKQSRSRSRDSERVEIQALSQKVKSLQAQVNKLEAENLELVEKSMQQTNDSSSDDDDPSQTSIKHKPKPKVKTLERQLQVLHSENIRLADKLGGYSTGTHLDPEEVIERIVELEDHCTDLQDRMRDTEGHERQIRDKLRVAEQTINELEISEAQYRDKCDELSRLERETKKQLHSLQTTGRELKEIILDKEILEQALKEKVEFLEKVEEQSSQRITELESVEKSLREQLESRESSSSTTDPSQLKAKLSAAEQEIHSLKERNNELEEDEEILRENWRRVADEDANRLRCLEQKVRMLEVTNQDLKTKLAEAQDFVVMNSRPTQGSLADELSASSRTALARALSDSPVSGGSDDESGEETPKKTVVKLKRQLSILEEEKNGKIANLQERLADLKENEIKLSETLVEMEMTERELRAKLALYESSEVTVEKMLKYQDKIDELRTSQESLLDQLETMETQEVTLQEQLEETERRLKGKIVTLEVEMKNLKHKELKGNARIRELEKHEEELTEKTNKQAEKENGLYVRISGLMDQVKEHKAKISEQEKKLAEKEERCRKVASLEAKFLQIEGAYRDKVTTLESSLAEAQSMLEEEEKRHQETKQTLDDAVQSRDKEHSQRVFILEEMFAQKEKGLNERIASLEGSVGERDRTISGHDQVVHDKDNRIAELEEELSVRESKICELETITSSRRSKESELEKSMSLKDEHIGNIQKDLNDRVMRISILEKDMSEKESRVSTLEKEVSDLQKDVSEKENIIADLERSVSEKVECISELERDLDMKQSRIDEVEKDVNENETLKRHLAEKDGHIDKLEIELREKVCNISNLQQELSRSESMISQFNKDVNEKDEQMTKLQKDLNDRVLHLNQLEKDNAKKDDEASKIVKDLSEKDNHISRLQTEICDKDSRVTHLETVLGDRENQIGELEAQLETKDRDSSNKLEEAREDLVNRDRHIAAMGEQITKMTVAVSELEKKVDEKDSCISKLNAQLKDQDFVVSEQMTKLQSRMDSEQKSATTKLSSLEDELVAVRSQLSHSEAKCEEYSRKLANMENEFEEEKGNVQSLKLNAETQVMEKERIQSELTAKLSDLDTQMREQDRDFQTQMSARESEFHQACSSLDAECESLRRDLMEKGRVIEKLESTKNDLLSKIENLKDREKEVTGKLSEVESDLSALLVQKDSEVQEAVLIWDKKLKDTEQEKETVVEKATSLEADLLLSRQTVQEQWQKMCQLETSLTQARGEIETLQSTLSQAQRQEEEVRTQREQFVHQETMLKTRVSQVEAQLQAHHKDQEAQQLNVSELLLQKQRVEEDLQKAHTDLSDSFALNSSLQETVSQLTQHTKSLQQEVADLQQLVKELEVCQEQEKEIQELLKEEKGRMQELESEISGLKDQREAALVEAENLQKELDLSKETISKLEADIVTLGQAEETLKSQISVEQSSRLEADRRLNESSEKATANQERTVQLLKEANEKDEEIDKLKVDLLLLRQELQTQQRLGLSIEEKDQELYSLKEKEEALQKREASLQERVLSMENQVAKRQEDHSQMCQKLHVLEKRETELLEQITDIEQSVIVPLEAENAELKEEITSMKQQTEALNLQIDKQEEQSEEDSAELEVLRKTVNDLQVSRTDAQSRLDSVMQELHQQESDNALLQSKVTDLEALNENIKDQLENTKTELDKSERELKEDLNDQETQTDSDSQVSETEWQNIQQKMTVLQDAESKFMNRIVDLEEHEQQLSEELECLLKEKAKHQQSRFEKSTSQRQISRDTRDASVDTEDLQETSTVKVPELFARVQELESANQRLSSSLDQATAGEVDRRQLTDKLHLLEQAEDRLMERVMELEENEVMLRTQLERSRHRANAADKLEEEVSLLLQQEDEWKEKLVSLTSENSALAEKVESLQNQFGDEQSKSDNLAFQIEAEQRQLQDVQTELKLVQTKLQSVRSEYEEKLSALEESEKKMESQLDSQSQRESDLHREIQVLREEMEDVCERYKELELENSGLKQEHSRVLVELKEAQSHGLQLAGGVSREPTLQAVQAHSHYAVLPPSSGVSSPYVSSPDPQYSTPPQVCSKLTVQMVPSTQKSAHASKSPDSSVQITQLKKDMKAAHSEGAGVYLPYKQGSVGSSEERSDSDSSGARSGSVQSVRVLTLHDALEENAALKAQLNDLQSRSVPLAQEVSPAFLRADVSDRKVPGDRQSADTLQLQAEVSRLQSQVAELEKSLKEAEGAVQEVVTVVRTRSVHTLEQKIETIQHTIHTQSPGWSLHQELLELLTSQADLQKQVSHLMETEHNLRMALKQVEDELARVKSGSSVTSLGARRLESDRRLSLQSRLSRFGGGISSTKAQGDSGRAQVDSSKKTKEQWLERQVADLQLAKTNLERRLHEAERRLAFRPRSTSASRDELLFRIEQLEEDQGEWRKKVEDLEALNSHYLKEKLELASERDSLERRLQTQSPGPGKEVSLFVGGRREEPLGRSGSVSEGELGAELESDDAMRDRPEDVLQKRIKELENLESYLRQQLNEVESDREQLHEIARKDKATIHEQNVRLRELMLQERNLRSQVSGLEDSERSLYNRCSELEDSAARLEDRVHELEVHERRLKELVRKLKLDEEVWLSKSGDLTASMEQLSSSEVSLRKMVQDLQLEKGRLSDRAEYLEVRIKELESLETTQVQRLKNYENVESSLQNRLQHTENSEAAAHSKASELDVINMDLSSRLQRAVEENAVLSQHVAQQQGQIHEMDRNLSAASDAQVGLSQHVESLQKSEGVLQKKVREYELRDIDAQARVRELEQTEEILKDKINQLQRNENRLKSRLVELETVGSQVLETMPPAQRQQLPQQFEDCQKRVVVLQRQLEAAQAERHQPQLAKTAEEEEATSVKVPTAALVEMRSKVALLEDTEYQMSELEKLNARLSDNILQLRQGKGSCGHEVELEVLKRRLLSYQNTIQTLKHHLSEGQVPSLRAADPGQGPESEDLPARHLQCLESERVLQSVRSLTQPPGLPHTQEEIVQAHSGTLQAGRAQGVASAASEPEESHWRTVELRCQAQQEGEPRGASTSMPHTSATASSALPPQEELIMGVSLPSESERGSFRSQNDTDSEPSGICHPHLRRVGSTTTHLGSPPTPGAVPSARGGRRGETQTPPMPTTTKPPTSTTLPSAQQQLRMNSGFVTDDSFYLPSSAASESESLEEGEAPPLPSSAPPGMILSAPPSLPPQPTASAEKTFVSAVTLPSTGQKSGDGVKGGEGVGGQKGRSQSMSQQPSLQTTSAVGLSIRQRIAQIERQLKENPSRVAGSKAEEDEVFTWKAKATENARLLGAAEREGKQLKEDINKLEKDLEEKRRYIYIFEKWILDAEEVLKNKNKKNDRDLVQQLQTEVKHLKQDLGNAGYRKDDIFTDPAALKTEVDRKDRELMAKRSEVESLAEEIEHWKQEAGSVEAMRKNALDSLRMLETEVTQLQDADIQLKQMKDEYNTLRGQYDEVNIQKNKAVAAVHMLRDKVTRLAQKCQEKDELLRRLSEEVRGGRGRSTSLLEELTRLETLAGGEEYNRPLSPLDLITGPATTDTERLLSERIPQATFTRWDSTTSLGDPRDLSADVLHSGDKTSLHRPKSAEQSRKGQRSAFTTKHPVGGGGGFGFGGESLCVAILDYVPDAASRSGHRHLELPLKEGDQVEVRGPVDRHGYCEAEVGGRTGLVPASHLYPLTASAAPYKPASQKHGLHKKPGVDSAEQIVQMFNELQDPRLVSGLSPAHSFQKSQHSRHSAATQTRQRQSISKTSMVPEAPTGLHIKEVDGSSLVLAWQPPILDQQGCSNGCKVVGYRIYLNGRVCQQPHNPRLSQTRVDGVRNDRPQQLAMQTLAASGQVSSRVELAYQGGSFLAHNHRDEDGESDTDLSSILNSVHYKTGKKRTVMGLYDYDPEKQSPGDYTACELAFNAGDLMLVYGEERQDGFFHGERNGKRGLVPACFVEPVVQDSKSTQKPGAPNGTASPQS